MLTANSQLQKRANQLKNIEQASYYKKCMKELEETNESLKNNAKTTSHHAKVPNVDKFAEKKQNLLEI